MVSSKHIVFINVHGGLPVCFQEAAIAGLKSFNPFLEQGCEGFTRMYVSNACSAASLHDLLYDAPVCSMTDASWHAWSKVRHGMRSIFHVMQQHGYKTHMMGAYGVDPSLDPHRQMRAYPSDVSKALASQGVDVYDTEDAAFTCRTATSHDAGVLQRVTEAVRSWAPEDKHFCIVNLLGCQDVQKLSWRDDPDFHTRVPTVDYVQWMQRATDDEFRVSSNIMNDDPRGRSDEQDPHVRMCRLHDYLRGERFELPSRDRVSQVVGNMHKYAWHQMRAMDASLHRLIDQLFDSASFVALGCDHPISLYEHGVMCEAPWETCSRTFLLTSSADMRARGGVTFDDGPRSMLGLPSILLRAAGIVVDWHITECPGVSGALTLSLSPSNLCRAAVPPAIDILTAKVFWARFVVLISGCVYACTYWWSPRDIVRATLQRSVTVQGAVARRTGVRIAANLQEWDALPQTEKMQSLSEAHYWRLPITDTSTIASVYNLTVDSHELENMWSAEFEAEEVFRILHENILRLTAHHRLDTELPLQFPVLEDINPDSCSTCSIQVQPKTRRDKLSTRSVYVQTDPTVSFSRPQESPHATPALHSVHYGLHGRHEQSAETGASDVTYPPAVPGRQQRTSILQKERLNNHKHR